MNLGDELLMHVQPFYDNPKKPNKKRQYQLDHDGLRYCPICQKWKLLSEFHKQTSNHSSGHQRHCIECKKEQMMRVRATRMKP